MTSILQTTTQADVRDVFDYDPEGFLVWRRSHHNHCTGKRAGTMAGDGYWRVCWQRKSIRAHRLIYLWHHGELPRLIDHIDRDRSNNRIENLRAVTFRANALNSDRWNLVSWHAARNTWRIQITDATGKRITRCRANYDDALLLAEQLREIHHDLDPASHDHP